jgi:hypothetical protein
MKYKCKECQHLFEGNDFTTECLQCNSPNIVVQKSGGTLNKATTKKILIGIGLIILLILLLKACGNDDGLGDSGNTLKVVVKIEPRDQAFFFTAYTLDAMGKKTEIQPYGVEKIKNTHTNSEVAFNKNGQLFLCYTDTGLTNLKFIFKDAELKDTTVPHKLTLFGKAPSSDAKCPIVLTWDDFEVSGPKNCVYELQLTPSGSRRPISLTNVKVSVSGINGPYTDKIKWHSDDAPNRKFEIYLLYNEKDTIKRYFRNGGDYPKCIPWTPSMATELAQRIMSLANAYGAKPSQRSLSRPFRELIFSFSNQVITLDGQKVDMADLENTMSTEYDNTGRKYRLSASPTFNADGTQVTIHFVRI